MGRALAFAIALLLWLTGPPALLPAAAGPFAPGAFSASAPPLPAGILTGPALLSASAVAASSPSDPPGLSAAGAAAVFALVLAALGAGRAGSGAGGGAGLAAGAAITAVIATFVSGWSLSRGLAVLWPLPAEAAGFAAQALLSFSALAVVMAAAGRRAGLWPGLVFSLLFCAFIQPAVAGWFRGMAGDGGGAVSVWLAGGLAGLAGALVLGPAREGCGGPPATARPVLLPPLAAAAVTIAAAGAAESAAAGVLLAAAGGGLTGLVAATLAGHRSGLGSRAGAGAVAGIVALSAAPCVPDLIVAPAAGVAGAILCRGTAGLMRRLAIADDGGGLAAVLAGAVLAPAVMVLWQGPDVSLRTMAPLLTGAAAFVFITSLVLWLVLDAGFSAGNPPAGRS